VGTKAWQVAIGQKDDFKSMLLKQTEIIEAFRFEKTFKIIE